MTRLERLEQLANAAREPTVRAAFRTSIGHEADMEDIADVTALNRMRSEIRGRLQGEAMRALPDLLRALRVFADEECGESGSTQDRCWDQDETTWPDEEWCRRCRALAPLLREELT